MEKRIDNLGINNLSLIQNPKYFCFGADAVLLSDFAKLIKNNSTILDIGTGNGILPILLSAKINAKKIYGLEIQPELVALANENVKFNKLEKLITITQGDICNIEKQFKQSSFDAIITNPPYKKRGTGLVNDNEYIKIAKHEIKCTLSDILEKANYLLKENGQLFMVHRPDRLANVLLLMQKNNIEPKLLRFVHPKPNKAPNLILIYGVKYAKPFLKILPPLYIYDNDNKYTEEIIEIYGKDAKYE